MSSGQSSGGGSSGGAKFLQVKDLEPNQKGFSLMVIVLDVSKPTQTKDGHEVRSVRIADKSGSVNLSVWNEFGAVLREGGINN
jgi:ssDNA-binding replication factor A large subunit